jgi:hypothetical protein
MFTADRRGYLGDIDKDQNNFCSEVGKHGS